MTGYIILARRNEAAGYTKASNGPVEAASATAAIRQWVESTQGSSGAYVAIPARSWQPHMVVIEDVRTVTVAPPPDGYIEGSTE